MSWNTANDDRCEHPAKIAVHPVDSDPPRRTGSPGGTCALDGDAHPVALPLLVEHRRAGTRSAQRRSPGAHAARLDAPPGASDLAEEPPWRSRSRGSRRPHPAFLEEIPSLSRETAVGWLSSCRPPSGRSPRAAPPVALRFCHSRSSASTSCNHLSLADVSPPSGEGRRATWMASGEEPKPPADRLDLDTVFRFADGAWPFATAGSTRVTSTPRRARDCPRGGDLGGWLAKPPRTPTSNPSLAQFGCHREERGHQDHLRAGGPAKGATVSTIRGAIHRVTGPRPGSRDRRAHSNDTLERVTSSTSHHPVPTRYRWCRGSTAGGVRTPRALAVTRFGFSREG